MYKANSFMRPNRMTIKQNKRISQSLEYGIKAGKSKNVSKYFRVTPELVEYKFKNKK